MTTVAGTYTDGSSLTSRVAVIARGVDVFFVRDARHPKRIRYRSCSGCGVDLNRARVARSPGSDRSSQAVNTHKLLPRESREPTGCGHERVPSAPREPARPWRITSHFPTLFLEGMATLGTLRSLVPILVKDGDDYEGGPPELNPGFISGVRWRGIGPAVAFGRSADAAVNSYDHLTLWVGTGENNGQRSVGYRHGVYRSIDDGRLVSPHWTRPSEHMGRLTSAWEE